MVRNPGGGSGPPRRRRGRPWPADYEPLVRTQILLPQELLDRLDRTAARDGTTRSDLVRRLLGASPVLLP